MHPHDRNTQEVQLPTDPLPFIELCWPGMRLSAKQRDVIMSVHENLETFVHAANKTGKTHVAALVAIWHFFSRTPARVIISSSSEEQLRRTLWSEIVNLIESSAVPLPFVVQDLLIKKLRRPGSPETYPLDFIMGCVTRAVESFQGHHLDGSDKPRVLAIFDEASSIGDEFFEACDSWGHRKLVIGNPLSNKNFFFRLCKAGDEGDPAGVAPLLRKVIHISGLDSPNVQLGMEMAKKGLTGAAPVVIPGLLTYEEFLRRREQWDEGQRTTRLFGQFDEGGTRQLFPPEWLDAAMDAGRWEELQNMTRCAEAMGVDVAAGGRDKTCWTVIDALGIIEQIVEDTPDTMQIVVRTIELLEKYDLRAQDVAVDGGGLGKPIIDRLREKGEWMRVVGFGESARAKTAYVNRRAEMYGELRNVFDPQREGGAFVLPPNAHKLRQELAILPLEHDSEGRLVLPPKNARPASGHEGLSIHRLLGRSPDRADSLALAWEALTAPLPGAKLPPLIYEGEIAISAPGFDNELWERQHPVKAEDRLLIFARDDRDRARLPRRVDDRR